MKCKEDIEKLSDLMLSQAECLLSANYPNGAYYLGGYTIELLLKARICKTLGIDDFFDFGNPLKTKIKNEDMVTRPFKVHDLAQLMILSGLYHKMEKKFCRAKISKKIGLR